MLGIGSSIAEIKAKLPLGDFVKITEYRKKYGTLSIARRIEMNKAVVANAVHVSAGWKTNPYMFTNWEQEPVYTSEDIIRMRKNGKL